LVNTGLLGALGHHAADQRGGGLVAAVLGLRLDVRVHRAGGDQGGPGLIVDHLGVDVLRAAEDRQPRPFGGAEQPVADPPLPTEPAGLHAYLLISRVHETIPNRSDEFDAMPGYFDPNALPALRRTNSPS